MNNKLNEEIVKDLADKIKSISVLNVNPDSILLLKMELSLPIEELELLQTKLSKFIGCKVLIICDQIKEIEVINNTKEES